MSNINPEMIVLARESRRLTQAELASQLSVSQAKISKYESGMLCVSEGDLANLSRVLHYPAPFFSQQDTVYGFGSSCLYHRKQKSLAAVELRAIHAKVNILRMQLDRLLRAADVLPPNPFPKMQIEDFGGSAPEIAVRLRSVWNLPLGPIRNMMAVIEAAGGIVFRYSFGTKKIDAVSHWPPGLPPLFFINTDMTAGDRLRLTLAHELGHLIMQNSASIDPEIEANQFAAEFLMPARQIAGDLSHISIPKAARLKPYWKVSMQALVKRAHDLGVVSPSAYRSLFAEFGRLGYRTQEPIPIPVEKPTILESILKIYIDDYNYNIIQLSSSVNFYEDEFALTYLPQEPNTTGFRVVG